MDAVAVPVADAPDGEIDIGVVDGAGATAAGCEEQALSVTALSTAKAAARLRRLGRLVAGMINRSLEGVGGQTRHRTCPSATPGSRWAGSVEPGSRGRTRLGTLTRGYGDRADLPACPAASRSADPTGSGRW